MKTKIDLPKGFFFGIAAITACFVFLIIGFLLYTAAPVLEMSGIGFITTSTWNYQTHQYGVLTFIIDTIILTTLTMILAVPLGILTAIYLTEWAPAWLERIIRPLIELLVGIPSVVYGLFGLFILANIYRDSVKPFFSNTMGFIPFFRDLQPTSRIGLLLAAIILAVMVLPTIIALSQDAMRSVPREYREGSLALGATRWETIQHVIIPAAFSGIVTSIILAMMRAMGETMAVVMVLGNSDQIFRTIFDQGYVLTAKILNDVTFYLADPEPRAALFGVAVVIFLLEFATVAVVRFIATKTHRD